MQPGTRSIPRLGLLLAVLLTAMFAVRALPASAVAATITNVAPNSGSTAGGTAVVITGTGFGTSGSPLVTAVTVGGNPATFAVVNNTTLNVTTPAGAAGTVDIVVTTDVPSANTAADDFTYGAPPAVASVSPNTCTTAGGTTITVMGSNFTGATTVNFGAAATSPTSVTPTSLTANCPAAGAPGPVSVRVTTPFGLSADTAADDFTYTALAPAVTVVNPNFGPIGGGTVVTLTGTGFTGATGVTFGGTPGTALTVNSDTSITVTTAAHAAGQVDVLVTTPAGTSPVSASAKFTYGGSGTPTVTDVDPPGGSIAGGFLVTITGTNFTGATSVTFGGTAATFNVTNSTTISAVAPAHAAGVVDVLVTTPGGTSANTAADNFTYGAGPVVTSLSPSSGNIVGGTVVTITGTGFTGATSVTFGGTAATFTVTNDTTISATAPAHAAGVVDVIVTTPVAASANTTADNFTYTAGPSVTDVSPASGPTTGGTTVVITGTGFTGATSVTFGGTAAASFTVNNSTQITAVTPAKAAGTVDVVVTTPLGASPNTPDDNFVFGSGPSITSISPTQGPTAGGTTVTITGTGFTGATAVTFGSTAATSFTVVSDSSITAVSPAGVNGVVRISVVTPIGTSADTAADNFTYGTGATTTFTLYFRWTLIVWNGKEGADIQTTLKNLESPDNPLTNDVSGIVTAVFHYNNPQQRFEAFFPGSAGVPGANDITTFVKGQGYWIAINSSGQTSWTVATD